MLKDTPSSSEPCLRYEEFCVALQSSRCEMFMSRISSFALEISKNETFKTNGDGEDTKTQRQVVSSAFFSLVDSLADQAIQNFSLLYPDTKTNFSFKTNTNLIPLRGSDDTFLNFRRLLMEYFERFIVEKVFNLFEVFFIDDFEKDAEFYWKLTWMRQWIKPHHLELNEDFTCLFFKDYQESDGTTFNLMRWICSQFASLRTIHYPKGKMTVFLQLCRLIFHVLSLACGSPPSEKHLHLLEAIKNEKLPDEFFLKNKSRVDEDSPSVISHESFTTYNITADDLMPALVWVLLNGSPHNIFFHLSFTRDFRHPSLQVSENLYYITMFQSAAEFLYALRVSICLHVPDLLDRKRCIESCPEKHLIEWIGGGWDLFDTSVTVEGTSPTQLLLQEHKPNSPLTTIGTHPPPVDLNASLLQNCKPLSSPFNISAMIFSPSAYNEFLSNIGSPICEKALNKLYLYINQVFLQTGSLEDPPSELQTLPEIFQPASLHQTMSICIRLILEENLCVFDQLLSQFGKQHNISLNTESDTFKLRFFKIVLLTESVERLLFLQIYEKLFPYMIGLSFTSLKSSSFYESFTSGFLSSSGHFLKEKVERFRRLWLSRNKFPTFKRTPILDEDIDTSVFYMTCQKLKEKCALTDLFQILHLDTPYRKKVNVVLRRLTHLMEYTSPLDKLKSFVALQRLAEAINLPLSTTQDKAKPTIVAALLLVHTTPKFLKAHLIFTETYRHPALYCQEMHDAMSFLWFVILLVEAQEQDVYGSLNNYSMLCTQLSLWESKLSSGEYKW